MKVPFWQPAREYKKYQPELDAAIQRVLSNGELVLGFGKDVEEFEKSFAEFIGTKHAIMCGAGTQALYLAYRALGIGQGDEVITTSHTFIATIDQIVAVGAKPILVDIGDDGLIDPEKIKEAITDKTKAIVPVHLEGKICNMPAIIDIANEHGLLVIEDSAQAVGAFMKDKTAGSWGDAGCFSLFPAKILGCFGNGGVVTTDNDELAARLKMMRCNWNIGKNPDIEGAEYGVNMEPDNLQAAVLNVKMRYLNDKIKARQLIAENYDDALWDLPIQLPVHQEGRVYQDYVIRVGDEKEQLLEFLKERGVGFLGHNLTPNHLYPKLGLSHFKLPKTEQYIKSQVRIPCNPELSREEQDYITDTINEFYSR